MKIQIYKGLLLIGLCLTLGFNSVPTIQNNTHTLTSPKFYDPSYSAQWDKFNNEIINTTAKTIIVYWSGYGGFYYIGDRTIYAIETAHRQGKTIIFKLTDNAISMHANVACHVDKIEHNGHAIIFHSGIDGRNKDGSRHYINERSYFDYCKARGYINDEDIYHILKLREKVEVYYDRKIYSEDYP